MDAATIAELKAHLETIRELLAAEPKALDRDRLLAVASAIDAKLQQVEEQGGGNDGR